MKRVFTLLTVAILPFSWLSAQFTMNGVIDEATYTTTINSSASPSCFGTGGSTLTAIKMGNTPTGVYIGIVGKVTTTSSNSIGLWINFTGLTGGTAAGASLKTAGGGHYMKAETGDPMVVTDFKADFEVDYMFAFNTGSTTTNCYVDAVKRAGGVVANYLDDIGQSGIELGGMTGAGVFVSSGITMAYNGGGGANQGIEIFIPYASVGLTAATAGSLQVFAVEVSGTAYFSNLTIPGNAGAACLGTNGAGAFATGTTSFSGRSGGPYFSTSIIPVELMSFTADRNKDNSVQVNWSTASERDNSHFDIERSADVRSWSTIGTVKGAGASNSFKKYSFWDDAPFESTTYYRLKQVDFNGKTFYSKTTAVNALSAKKQTLAFPNPAKDLLNIGNTEGADFTAEVYNILGKRLLNQSVSNAQLDISALPNGVYQLRVVAKNGLSVGQTQFVKQ